MEDKTQGNQAALHLSVILPYRKMPYYKQELLRGVLSKNLTDTMLYKVNLIKHMLKQGSLIISYIQFSPWWPSVLWCWIIAVSGFISHLCK